MNRRAGADLAAPAACGRCGAPASVTACVTRRDTESDARAVQLRLSRARQAPASVTACFTARRDSESDARAVQLRLSRAPRGRNRGQQPLQVSSDSNSS